MVGGKTFNLRDVGSNPTGSTKVKRVSVKQSDDTLYKLVRKLLKNKLTPGDSTTSSKRRKTVIGLILTSTHGK